MLCLLFSPKILRSDIIILMAKTFSAMTDTDCVEYALILKLIKKATLLSLLWWFSYYIT